ncbi:DUF6933 domain-containing protein [Paenibacillus wynnii]|uniref:DUF6933 domain-containing protein n=1 Tax=Paenibacillus wynnii TaxID=268407 RepID=UPI0027948F4A|nr:hypothetical protein [Paenibacillus wynnii]MDQ0195256.1 hypothetical protein [Paenibacillus wynnii]
MTTISCTKKLFDYSNLPQSPVPEIGYDPLLGWHAHIYRGGKKNCLIIMNDLTRYQILLYGVKKEHFRNFEDVFLSNLEMNLKADHFSREIITDYISKLGNLIYTKTHNRSILGSINDQALISTHWIERYLPSDELNINEFNKRMNDSIILKIKESVPRIAMQNALNV